MSTSIAILLLCAAFLVNGQQIDPEIEQKCYDEVGLSVKFSTDIKPNNQDEVEKTKCALACILKSLKLMKPDGSFDLSEGMKQLAIADLNNIDDSSKLQILQTCAQRKGKNDCDTADAFQTCVADALQNFGKRK